MAGNKHSDETRKKILDVAQSLFYEKGYDNTTIQDIVDGLGGLTKGVIYHHFDSKKDILENVMNNIGLSDGEKWYENWQGETGLEKIKLQILKSLKNFERYAILYSAESLLKSPRMIGEVYLSDITEVAGYLQIYINEGIKDGSIVTEYPQELAEFIALTIDVWFGLNIVRYSRKELENKLYFLQCVFQSIGVPLIDETILASIFNVYDYINIKNNC